MFDHLQPGCKPMKRLLAAFAAILATVSLSLAANVPYLTGPIDPGNLLGAFNAFISSLNNTTGGNLAAITAFTTSDTSADTAMAYTLPGGFLAQVGQAVQVTAWGVNSADANVKTVTFNFGALAVACVVTGSSAKWEVEFTVMKTGASTQDGECHGTEGTTVIASVQPAAGAVTDTAAIALTLTATAATSGTTTIAAAYLAGIK